MEALFELCNRDRMIRETILGLKDLKCDASLT
jgi:hypothetical protein